MANENILEQIRSEFQPGEQDLQSYSPLVLAYIGDAVYELVVRTILAGRANCPVQKLHKMATSYVKAEAQAKLIQAVMDELTEEEQEIFRRGRNAKSHTIPKNASIRDYRRATGMEAVIGYLYLKNDMQRALDIIGIGLECLEKRDD